MFYQWYQRPPVTIVTMVLPLVLSSLYYERMQVCDDVIISLVCVSLWSQICKTSR